MLCHNFEVEHLKSDDLVIHKIVFRWFDQNLLILKLYRKYQ